MSEIKRIPLSASGVSDPWLDLEQKNALNLLQHLRSDNIALVRLRDALSADADSASWTEAPRG